MVIYNQMLMSTSHADAVDRFSVLLPQQVLPCCATIRDIALIGDVSKSDMFVGQEEDDLSSHDLNSRGITLGNGGG
jgi:hypothetical protein